MSNSTEWMNYLTRDKKQLLKTLQTASSQEILIGCSNKEARKLHRHLADWIKSVSGEEGSDGGEVNHVQDPPQKKQKRDNKDKKRPREVKSEKDQEKGGGDGDGDGDEDAQEEKKPFSCTVCGRSFKRKWNCQRHMATHTEQETDAGCPFSKCGVVFEEPQRLLTHMTQVHGLNVARKDQQVIRHDDHFDLLLDSGQIAHLDDEKGLQLRSFNKCSNSDNSKPIFHDDHIDMLNVKDSTLCCANHIRVDSRDMNDEWNEFLDQFDGNERE